MILYGRLGILDRIQGHATLEELGLAKLRTVGHEEFDAELVIDGNRIDDLGIKGKRLGAHRILTGTVINVLVFRCPRAKEIRHHRRLGCRTGITGIRLGRSYGRRYNGKRIGLLTCRSFGLKHLNGRRGRLIDGSRLNGTRHRSGGITGDGLCVVRILHVLARLNDVAQAQLLEVRVGIGGSPLRLVERDGIVQAALHDVELTEELTEVRSLTVVLNSVNDLSALFHERNDQGVAVKREERFLKLLEVSTQGFVILGIELIACDQACVVACVFSILNIAVFLEQGLENVGCILCGLRPILELDDHGTNRRAEIILRRIQLGNDQVDRGAANAAVERPTVAILNKHHIENGNVRAHIVDLFFVRGKFTLLEVILRLQERILIVCLPRGVVFRLLSNVVVKLFLIRLVCDPRIEELLLGEIILICGIVGIVLVPLLAKRNLCAVLLACHLVFLQNTLCLGTVDLGIQEKRTNRTVVNFNRPGEGNVHIEVLLHIFHAGKAANVGALLVVPFERCELLSLSLANRYHVGDPRNETRVFGNVGIRRYRNVQNTAFTIVMGSNDVGGNGIVVGERKGIFVEVCALGFGKRVELLAKDHFVERLGIQLNIVFRSNNAVVVAICCDLHLFGTRGGRGQYGNDTQ